jgi:hypothetical protein
MRFQIRRRAADNLAEAGAPRWAAEIFDRVRAANGRMVRHPLPEIYAGEPAVDEAGP